MDKTEIVMALYRPLEGQDSALRALIEQHVPALRKAGLITERPALLLRAQDGTLIEVFEWRSGASARQAHDHPIIGPIWGQMAQLAELTTLSSLAEAGQPFPHFEPVD